MNLFNLLKKMKVNNKIDDKVYKFYMSYIMLNFNI